MLPKVFAIYHSSTETFQVLQTETLEDGSIARLKNWARPSLRDWSTTAAEDKAELMRWSKGQEWYVCKTNRALAEVEPQIYTETIHGKQYRFWFLNHMLVWSNHLVYRGRHGETKSEWMKSPMIPVVEFATKQIYPRTNTSFYTFWSETTKEDVEEASIAVWGHESFRELGVVEHDHIDPRYLRIKTPSPRDDDWMTSEDCCHSEAKKRGRGFSDAAEEIEEEVVNYCGGKNFTQRASIAVLITLLGLWSASVAVSVL